jgi:hypothetical protein
MAQNTPMVKCLKSCHALSYEAFEISHGYSSYSYKYVTPSSCTQNHTSNALYVHLLPNSHHEFAVFSPFLFCITTGGAGLNLGSNKPAYICNQPLSTNYSTARLQKIPLIITSTQDRSVVHQPLTSISPATNRA